MRYAPNRRESVSGREWRIEGPGKRRKRCVTRSVSFAGPIRMPIAGWRHEQGPASGNDGRGKRGSAGGVASGAWTVKARKRSVFSRGARPVFRGKSSASRKPRVRTRLRVRWNNRPNTTRRWFLMEQIDTAPRIHWSVSNPTQCVRSESCPDTIAEMGHARLGHFPMRAVAGPER